MISLHRIFLVFFLSLLVLFSPSNVISANGQQFFYQIIWQLQNTLYSLTGRADLISGIDGSPDSQYRLTNVYTTSRRNDDQVQYLPVNAANTLHFANDNLIFPYSTGGKFSSNGRLHLLLVLVQHLLLRHHQFILID